MFRKILIANRGEIACRIISTAHKLGVKTVAVYSDVDASSKHVTMADEAFHIGGSAAADSYLRGDHIIDVALKAGAQAIHPGYGFLSENPDFVDAVVAAGLVFIGPSANAIRAMGLKDAAKALMEKAGIPIVPGYHGAEQNPDFLASEAEKIGYPVLIKARAGGGGKGMRLVENPSEFPAALEGAKREGQASFGDSTCLIEKFITHPRHIEIQVFGDNHGNAVHLFERDCSLQRRHQKVIEEAPAPNMPQAVRDAMGQAAVNAVKAIGYSGAGTIEFIVDGSGELSKDRFWFMEMNTRLQVEHTISEAITGKDFVELQLRIAAGKPIPFTQDELTIDGWSFEARLYAEDVPEGFLPATGTLNHLNFPKGATFSIAPNRIDSGVRQGDEVSPWYDPMIAKIITHGPTRNAALNMLTSALEKCQIAGTVTNVEFLHALSKHEGFANGNVDTGLIARDIDILTEQSLPTSHAIGLGSLVGLGLLKNENSNDPWQKLQGWQHWSNTSNKITLIYDNDEIEVCITTLGSDRFDIAIKDEIFSISAMDLSDNIFVLEDEQNSNQLSAVKIKNTVAVFEDGRSYSFQLHDALEVVEDNQSGGDAILAPMPGLVKIINTSVGATVKKGDPLIVLEAMKMEHTLSAPRDGVIAEIHTTVDEQVTDKMSLITLEPNDE